jgi:hypothetical protein
MADPEEAMNTMSARVYRMAVFTSWYDKTASGAREYELHFIAVRHGSIRTIRRALAKRGVPYLQGLLYRRLKKWIPKRKVKVRFEREQPALRSESKISVEGRSMLFRGKRWRAYPLGRWDLNYAKKKRRKRR